MPHDDKTAATKSMETSAPFQDQELELRRLEFEIRRQELSATIARERRNERFKVSPLITAVVAAVTGLLGTGLGALIQGWSNVELEERKLESALVLKAIETGDRDSSARNLIFLVRANLIRDPTGAIGTLKESSETSPVLPARNPLAIWGNQATPAANFLMSREFDEFLDSRQGEGGLSTPVAEAPRHIVEGIIKSAEAMAGGSVDMEEVLSRKELTLAELYGLAVKLAQQPAN